MGIKKNSRTHIIEFIILASILPLLIFLLFFFVTLQNLNRTIQENNNHLQDKLQQDVSLFLHQISTKTNVIVGSFEMRETMHLFLEEERYNSHPISELKHLLQEQLPLIENWQIVGLNNKILFENQNQQSKIVAITQQPGFFWNPEQKNLTYRQPIFYEFSGKIHQEKRIVAFFVNILPLELLQQHFPSIVDIKNISPDLGHLELEIKGNPSSWEKKSLYKFSLSILFTLLCLLIGIYFIAKKIHKKTLFLLQKESAEKSRLAAIGEVAQLLAHDIRKPFYSMNVILENIAQKKSLGEIKEELSLAIPEFSRSLRHVDGMLKEILEFSANTLQEQSSISLEETLSQCLQELSRNFPEKKINFHYSLQHQQKLWGDATKIYRIFLNILSNAFEALPPEGGVITITTKLASQGKISVVIHNDGPPIPTEYVEKIFAPHFTKGKKNGTGLGLAICKKFIDLHGGEIALSSREKQGVSFTFTLPCQGELYTPQFQGLPQTTGKRERPLIVLIEDDPLIRRAWQRSLEEREAELLSFIDPVHFLSFYKDTAKDWGALRVFILDNYFAHSSLLEYREFLDILGTFFPGKAILCSETPGLAKENLQESEFAKIFLMQKGEILSIPKKALTFAELEEKIARYSLSGL